MINISAEATLVITTVLEVLVCALLILGFVFEDEVVAWEEKKIYEFRILQRARKQKNVSVFRFIKIVLWAVVTPMDKIYRIKEKEQLQ